MVYVLSLASGVVTAIDNPSRQSFYVEMVGEEHVRNAVSLNSAAFTGSRVIGPAVAGVLIATVGIATCFLIDGLSYAAVLVALFAMRSGGAAPAEAHHPRPWPPDGRSAVRVGHRRSAPAAARDGGRVHGVVQLRGVRAPTRGTHVRWRRRHLRRPVRPRGSRVVPRGDRDGEPRGRTAPARPRRLGGGRRRVARAAGARAHAVARGGSDDPDGIHDHGLHDHRATRCCS